MIFHVYVLQSKKHGGYYKGQTSNPSKRLYEHNAGKSTYTKNGVHWELIYSEEFLSREDALTREKYFKSAAGRRFLKSKYRIQRNLAG